MNMNSQDLNQGSDTVDQCQKPPLSYAASPHYTNTLNAYINLLVPFLSVATGAQRD